MIGGWVAGWVVDVPMTPALAMAVGLDGGVLPLLQRRLLYRGGESHLGLVGVVCLAKAAAVAAARRGKWRSIVSVWSRALWSVGGLGGVEGTLVASLFLNCTPEGHSGARGGGHGYGLEGRGLFRQGRGMRHG